MPLQPAAPGTRGFGAAHGAARTGGRQHNSAPPGALGLLRDLFAITEQDGSREARQKPLLLDLV
ncbi:MAG TPA: hypothetical protein VMW56_31975, partial [Candidatus Margulisiibacteriota bacterium]|nr:hypothetical protein [Candidatus Margulisiibacteriota bacterium]